MMEPLSETFRRFQANPLSRPILFLPTVTRAGNRRPFGDGQACMKIA
jgi:hypothetical protein